MEYREGRFTGARGVGIAWRAWLPENRPRARVVISHGASEHCGRYAHVAERLVADGLGVYALDHRGHGRSDGPRAVIDRIDHAVADVDRMVDMVRHEGGGEPPFLLGHSAGGCIAVSYVFRHQDKLRALALSGPLLALRAADPLTRMAGRILSAVAPRAGIVDIDADAVSRDSEEVRKYREDPLNYHGRVPARTIGELIRGVEAFPPQAPRIRLPLLIMHGEADRIAPPEGSRVLHQLAGSPDKRLVMYPGLFHEIFNELEADRRRVLDDLAAWLAAHQAV